MTRVRPRPVPSRDRPGRDRRGRESLGRALALGLAVLLAAPLAVARAAGPSAPGPARATATGAPRVATARGDAEQEQLFRELTPLEDESLAEHRAGGWSTFRIVVIVLLCIFLLPIGLIVLITCLIVDPP